MREPAGLIRSAGFVVLRRARRRGWPAGCAPVAAWRLGECIFGAAPQQSLRRQAIPSAQLRRPPPPPPLEGKEGEPHPASHPLRGGAAALSRAAVVTLVPLARARSRGTRSQAQANEGASTIRRGRSSLAPRSAPAARGERAARRRRRHRTVLDAAFPRAPQRVRCWGGGFLSDSLLLGGGGRPALLAGGVGLSAERLLGSRSADAFSQRTPGDRSAADGPTPPADTDNLYTRPTTSFTPGSSHARTASSHSTTSDVTSSGRSLPCSIRRTTSGSVAAAWQRPTK